MKSIKFCEEIDISFMFLNLCNMTQKSKHVLTLVQRTQRPAAPREEFHWHNEIFVNYLMTKKH